jgi:hypothetical protein
MNDRATSDGAGPVLVVVRIWPEPWNFGVVADQLR